MKHALFIIPDSSLLKKALKELESHGLEHPYFIEEPGSSSINIGGFFKKELPSSLENSTYLEQSHSIDWDYQWKTFSPYYKDGLLEVNLNHFGSQLPDPLLYLEPGPGFGDLSHITTHLMLEMMPHYVRKKHVLDIGCGSGILSLAAHKLGATSVLGLDIDTNALEHSKKNALLNGFYQLKFHKLLTVNDLFETILINMTFNEHKIVFSQYPYLKGIFIVSGILKSQKTRYLDEFSCMEFSYIESVERENWLSLVLSNLK